MDNFVPHNIAGAGLVDLSFYIYFIKKSSQFSIYVNMCNVMELCFFSMLQ